MKPVGSANEWWREMAAEDGLRLLDQHVGTDADWATAAKTGLEDFQRAVRLTGMPSGPDLSLLEIGCGAGRMTWVLAEAFGQVVAADVSPAYVKMAEQHCARPNVSYRTISGYDLEALGDRLFDVAFTYEVFHYLEQPILERYVSDVYRFLRQGGSFVLQLNTAPMGLVTHVSLLIRRLMHLVGKRSWRGWPTSPYFARKPYSADAICGILTKAGFEIQKVVQPGQRQTWFLATAPIHIPSP
jgi:ubiquinone/menaquinone biosynthesis C-methylase UbiE